MGDEIRKKLLLFGIILLTATFAVYASEAPAEAAHAAAEHHYPYVFTGVETLFAVIGCFYFALFVNVFSKFLGKEVE